jgi:hypothetical protein
MYRHNSRMQTSRSAQAHWYCVFRRWALVAACLLTSAALGQQSAVPADASSPSISEPQAHDSGAWHDTLHLVSKRSAFFPNLATHSGPISSGQKFKLFVNNSLSGAAVLGSVVSAGFAQATDSHDGYGQGADGFAKRFGSAMARNATSNFVGTYALASVLHQDPRFFVSGKEGFRDRVKYASRRLFVIRTDSGGEAFNWSGLLGPLAAEGIANTYLPDKERTGGDTLQRYGLDLAGIVGANIAREYWPTIFKKLRMPSLAPATVTEPQKEEHH